MLVGAGEETTTPDDETIETTDLEAGFDVAEAREAPESGPTPLRCPDCGGALWELEDGGLQSYACHVGCTYSADSLLEEQGDAVERALWTAVRMLEERAELSDRLSERRDGRATHARATGSSATLVPSKTRPRSSARRCAKPSRRTSSTSAKSRPVEQHRRPTERDDRAAALERVDAVELRHRRHRVVRRRTRRP